MSESMVKHMIEVYFIILQVWYTSLQWLQEELSKKPLVEKEILSNKRKNWMVVKNRENNNRLREADTLLRIDCGLSCKLRKEKLCAYLLHVWLVSTET